MTTIMRWSDWTELIPDPERVTEHGGVVRARVSCADQLRQIHLVSTEQARIEAALAGVVV